jgi:hypothetical protein
MPLFVVHKEESQFYEKIYVMIPLCGGIVTVCVVLVGVWLYCRRRREILHYKGRARGVGGRGWRGEVEACVWADGAGRWRG